MTNFTRSRDALARIGAAYYAFLTYFGAMAILAVHSVSYFLRVLVGRAAVNRFRRREVAAQMVRVGIRAVPIVTLVLLFVGMVIAFQMAYVLRKVGLKDWVAQIVAVSMLRELGPLLTAVVMSGFAGASIAAELGTMVVGEEIEALRSEALDPVKFLVMPRVIATAVMMVCLTVVANVVGIFGGFIVATQVLGVNPYMYYEYTVKALETQDLITGLIKAGAFGLLISLIACYLGLKVSGGAEGVGRATTLAVVFGIVGIIATDLVFSALFYLVL